MKNLHLKTKTVIFTPGSPGLPQALGEGKSQYSWGFARFSPDTPSFFKLTRKSGYI